jgi:hypothetical protein
MECNRIWQTVMAGPVALIFWPPAPRAVAQPPAVPVDAECVPY